MGCSMPGLPVSYCLLEFFQVHLHCISDAIQLSHPLMPSSPSALSLSQDQELFQWVDCSYQETKILEFSFSISPSNEYSGLISFKIDWFDLVAVNGLSSVFSSTTVQRHHFRCSAFFTVQLLQLYITTGKTIVLTNIITFAHLGFCSNLVYIINCKFITVKFSKVTHHEILSKKEVFSEFNADTLLLLK